EEVRANVTRIILAKWSERDPDAAMNFAVGQEDELVSRSYAKAVINRLALTDPARGFDLALQTNHTAIQSGSARWTLLQWMGTDPIAAGEAYAGMPAHLFEGEQMVRSASTIGGSTAREDLEKAIALADQIPHEPSRRQWIYGTAWEGVNQDAGRAIALAETLPSSKARQRLLKHLGRQWMKAEPNEAGMWIEESGYFEPATLENLLNPES
ncbi:MAG: hypothetical protein AAF514_19430, partial [Verrucomicrobiota bacterium]